MATRVLDHRSVSYHWRLNAHRGAVNCVWVRVVPETNLQRIYTGGDDGSLRVWDHKGNVVMEMTGHTAPIHALFYANGKVLPLSFLSSRFLWLPVSRSLFLVSRHGTESRKTRKKTRQDGRKVPPARLTCRWHDVELSPKRFTPEMTRVGFAFGTKESRAES